MTKRYFPDHLLSDSESVEGTFHASVLPPTKISLAAEMLKRRKMKNRQDLEKPAMSSSRERERERVVYLTLPFLFFIYSFGTMRESM